LQKVIGLLEILRNIRHELPVFWIRQSRRVMSGRKNWKRCHRAARGWP